MQESRTRWAAPVAAAVVLVLAAASQAFQYALPSAAAMDAPETAFSATRAMYTIIRIAQIPHPVYAREKLAVRDDIARMIREAGLQPVFQDESVISVRKKSGGDIANVWTRIPAAGKGTGAGPIVFVAHYDSVPFGPGAVNDASGCAVLLEAARALNARGMRKDWPARDIVFLWTDGEEFGQLGAEAYVLSATPKPALAINVEYSRGPQYMSGSLARNGRLLDALSEAGVRPCGYSWLDLLTSRMSFDNDYSPFKAAGIPGLNLASLASYVEYHTARDLPQASDPRAIQESGDMVTALASTLGARQDDDFFGEPQAFMTIAGRQVLRYPAWLALPLSLLAGALLAGALAVLVSRKRLRLGQALRGVLACLALLAVSALLGKVVATLAGLVRTDYVIPRYSSRLPNDWLWALAHGVLAVGLYLVVRARTARKLSLDAVTVGFAMVLDAGALALSIAAPTASTLLLVPALVLSACLLGTSLLPPRAAVWTLAPAALAVCLTFVPLGVMLWAGLGMGGMAFLCPIAALLCMGCAPFMEASSAGMAKASLVSGVFFVALSGAALVAVRFTAACPAPTNVGYVQNSDTGQSAWYVLGGAKTAWQRETTKAASGQIELGPILRFSPIVPSQAFTAPALNLEQPTARLVSESTSGGSRRLVLEIRGPGPGALMIGMPGSVGIDSIGVGGRLYDPKAFRTMSERGGDGEERLQLTYYPLYPDGLTMSLLVTGTLPRGSVPLLVASWADELHPAVPRPPLPAVTWPQNDSTMVVKTFMF
jgi:hypothetical protein